MFVGMFVKEGRMPGPKKWLPFPMWFVVLMFVVGAGIGTSLGVMVYLYAPEREQQTAVNIKDAVVLPDPAEEKVAEAPTQPVPAQPESPKPGEIVLPAKNDPRHLANVASGPVKRALTDGVAWILRKGQACKQKSSVSGELLFRFEFEAVGGMATLNEGEVYSAKEEDKALLSCLLKAVQGQLMDFPVEDSQYEILVAIDPSTHQMSAASKAPAK